MVPTTTPPGAAADEGDLGFRHRVRKDGAVEILHQGRLASTLRGKDASAFKSQTAGGTFAAGQQAMARWTGNYKHGNEGTAGEHPRNRG